ncbi:MAG: hypothetical protein IKO11_07460 [Lachnospiraceae bacterium]|nr:hypothetical protein [Lachnospiraceae bacterium]
MRKKWKLSGTAGLALMTALAMLLAACGDQEKVPVEENVTATPAAVSSTPTPVPTDIPEEDTEAVSENIIEGIAEVPAALSGDPWNQYVLSNVEEIGSAAAGGPWTQADIITLDDALKEKLQPDTVIEIDYRSATGRLWLVFDHAKSSLVKDAKGRTKTWVRVGAGIFGDCGDAVVNGAHDKIQLSYAQIAAVMGERIDNWGDNIQAESDGDWEVLSVRLGRGAKKYALKNAVDAGRSAKGDAWERADIIPDITSEEVAEKLKPGSVIEISYTSDTGELWVVMPDAENAVAQGEDSGEGVRVGVRVSDEDMRGNAVCDGKHCYIPYELIVQYCGPDPARWGQRMQAEASSSWEVTGIRIGEGISLSPLNFVVEKEQAAESASGEAADLLDLKKEEIASALQPGSVITIEYESEGDLWLVLPKAGESGEEGIEGSSVVIGKDEESGRAALIREEGICRIPFEAIAAYCGEDVSTWGPVIQAEGSAGWKILRVSVGRKVE